MGSYTKQTKECLSDNFSVLLCLFRLSICFNPQYPLATFLKEIIVKSIKKEFGYIKNSFEFVNNLISIALESNYKLVSFDIISMYTNIPIELITKNIEKRWRYISKNTSIPKKEFLNAISLIIHSTYFKFDNKFFKQIFGMPIGFLLLSISANLVIQDLEDKIFFNININILIYYRYVDDILLAVPNNQINEILDNFNSYNDRLRFIVEHGDDNSINFLDVRDMILDDGCIKFDMYKKTHELRKISNLYRR